MIRPRSILVSVSFLLILVTSVFGADKPDKPKEMAVSKEAATTYADVEQTLGFVPSFVKLFPQEGIAGAWEEMKAVEFGETAIPGKYKSLIAVAVAAQIPCQYCLYIDTKGARLEGATDREIQEAIAMAAITRHWSTILNGGLIDQATFEKEASQIFAYVQKPTKGAMAPAAVTDADSAYKDIEATFGIVPGFMKVVPKQGIAGAWKEMKSVQLNPNTAIPGKYKEAIGLAVAAQIPCHYCAYFHTEAMKLNGATEDDVKDAIAMSALTRHWSTVLNGNQIDFTEFKKEADRMIDLMQKQMSSGK